MPTAGFLKMLYPIRRCSSKKKRRRNNYVQMGFENTGLNNAKVFLWGYFNKLMCKLLSPSIGCQFRWSWTPFFKKCPLTSKEHYVGNTATENSAWKGLLLVRALLGKRMTVGSFVFHSGNYNKTELWYSFKNPLQTSAHDSVAWTWAPNQTDPGTNDAGRVRFRFPTTPGRGSQKRSPRTGPGTSHLQFATQRASTCFVVNDIKMGSMQSQY